MGRIQTPPYRIEFTDNTKGFDAVARTDGKKVKMMLWHSHLNGRPTDEKLAEFMVKYGKSLEAGGVNEHISKMMLIIPYPTWARLVGQTGKKKDVVVAEWNPGPFVAW